MFGEQPGFGFTPLPVLDLRAGNLYNFVVSLLIFLACAAAWRIILRRRREKIFSGFLLALGLHWLLAAAANFLAWLNLAAGISWLAYPLKTASVIPFAFLGYFLTANIFQSMAVRRAAFSAYLLAAAACLAASFRFDSAQAVVTYWGAQWPAAELTRQIFLAGVLLPLALGSVYLFVRAVSRKLNTSLYQAAIIFVLLEYIRISAVTVTWQALVARLFYILIAFSAYLYFADHSDEKKFVPRGEKVAVVPRRRLPVFEKLLLLFFLLAVIPIVISSLLMFSSFREITDLYIYKPLLFNLKTSREAFLQALDHVQYQALFVTLVTGLLVIVASIAVSREISRSLRRLATAMGRVSRGDFSFRLLPDSNDEIGDVVNYFNEMADEIKRARDLMENWNRELEAKVQERTEDLRVLFDVSRQIGSSLDFELLISRALDRLRPIIKAEAYAIMVADDKGKSSAKVCRGCEAGDIPFEGGAGWTRVPLHAKGQTMGQLMIKGDPGERGRNLLATIADQLAIAIENVTIYEKEKEAVARLTELDRLKNEFISMVSHELRTPITSADGYVSLFLAGVTGPLSDDQKNYLTIVRENNQRLLTLVNRLLDFSRIESGRFTIKHELISIHEIIQTTAEKMKPQIDKRKATVALKLEAKNVNFMGDAEKMEEVFTNLIENALKFGREGAPPEIQISTRDAGDFIEVIVEDNGAGIESEYLEKIFNKFFQIEDAMTRQAGGVGLGLALVKEIIGNHHGRVWAESEGKSKGARFIFTLPVAEKA